LVDPKKRPAWDVKGRLEDNEKLMQKLCDELGTTRHELSKMKTEISEKETKSNKE
jgi:hypothetical protein